MLRRAQRDADGRDPTRCSTTSRQGFNPYWGLMFKEGNENCRFGEQVEHYACLYTSRVSNLLFYSPMQYFRSPREAMPHERHVLHMAPYGDEHGAPAAGDRPSKTSESAADERRPPGRAADVADLSASPASGRLPDFPAAGVNGNIGAP